MPSEYTDDEIAAFKARLSVDPETGCHNWTGCKQQPGKRKQHPYGIARLRGKQMNAHRIAMMFHLGGPIPSGKWVLHRCDNPPCCNPRHLYCGSPLDNAHDMMARGRRPKRMRGQSISDERVLEMAATGLSITELSRRFGHYHETVHAAFARLGLSVPTRAIPDSRYREIAAMNLPTYSAMEKATGHMAETIRRGFVRLGLPRPDGLETPPNYIPDERYHEIAASRLSSFREMSDHFGHCRQVIAEGFCRLGIPPPSSRGRPRGRKSNSPTKEA